VQGLLDILDIPYTHSGLLASALAMDKVMAKRLFSEAGITVAEHVVASSDQVLAGDLMPKPYVIKPVNEGSSVGVHIVREGDNTEIFSGSGWPFGDNVMVEKFIEGRELSVAVMGDRPLVVTEITTGRGFYDYDAKYEEGGSEHIVPADLGKDVTDEVLRLALLAHQTLGCRGISRSDFRYDGKDIFILETNTQPGLAPTSLLPEQAAHVGISFKELIVWLIENAECDS
jgi:D-alanine-D-alanine ligase